MGVFRKQTTRPIPQGAKHLTVKGVPSVRYAGRDGKLRTVPLTDDGQRILLLSAKWYGTVPGGQPVPLSVNKASAETMLRQMLHKAEMGRAGLLDPYETQRGRPLQEHLEDYLTELGRKAKPKHVGAARGCLQALLRECGFATLADLDGTKVATWLQDLHADRPPVVIPEKSEFQPKEVAELLEMCLSELNALRRRLDLPATGNGKARRYTREVVCLLAVHQSRGMSPRGCNSRLAHVKAFGAWLAGNAQRVPTSPVARLKPLNEREDVRHARRALSAEELARLLSATKSSAKVLRGFTGVDRYHLYATACGTGFRAGGLASLTPAHFSLDSTPPLALLTVKASKNKKRKEQVLPGDLVVILRDYLKGRAAHEPVWPGGWTDRAADMLRHDLSTAGIPYVVHGPEGPAYADFHALRHTYLTLLGQAGVDLRTLQELAGHSTPTLTARYMHKTSADLARGVAKLPPLCT